MAFLTQASPLTIPVRGNTTLVVDGVMCNWAVVSGQVAIFRAKVADGIAVGPRQYLLTCQAGDAIFGSLGPSVTGDHRFIVVGIEDALLRPVPLALFAELLKKERKRAINHVERWVQQVTNLMIADNAPTEAPVNPSSAADEITLTPGQVFAATRREVCWARFEMGAASMLGLPSLRVDSEADLVPLGSGAWFKVEEPAQVTLRATSDDLGADVILRGLGLLHHLLFSFLKIRDEEEAQRERARLHDRHRQEVADSVDAMDALSRVFDPRRDAAPPADSPLMAALAAIGEELQVTFKSPGRSEDMSRVQDPLDAVARASRVRLRYVTLRGHWWKSDCGPLLAFIGEERDEPVALIRGRRGKYEVVNPVKGYRRPLDSETKKSLSAQAVMFYRPFPDRVLKLLDLPRFASRLYWKDLVLIVLIAFGTTMLGMLVPQATRWIIDQAIPDANTNLLVQFALILFAVNCGQAAFMLAQGVATLRAQSGAVATLQASTLDRVIRLPMRFFQRFTSGDLLNRTMMITEISQEISGTTLRTLVTGALSLLNFGLLLYYSASLALVAVGVAFLCSIVTASLSWAIRSRAVTLEQMHSQLFGFEVQILTGVAKVRVAGAERRAYNHWVRRYAEQLKLSATVKQLEDYGHLFNFVVPTFSTILIYFMAMTMLASAKAGIGAALSMGTFLAFYSAFGTFVAGATQVSHTIVDIMEHLVKQRLIQPILEARPESEANRADPGRLTGRIALENMVFRYREDGPLILNGISLQAHPGEFIALVGSSGSGKSTILRLILGFETAESGRVLFDGKNLDGLDLTGVRRQIGVVLQAARINAASVFDNIACGNRITLDEAWVAARDAGFEDDLKQMPMGMHTVISEGGTNLSGGQRQRLLIARALVINPKILLFDEATSALDNRTQAIVSQSLERRKVTRVVIAHRLSTIRNADRIYVLDKGKLVQTGTFEQLTGEDGMFRRMAARQTA